MFLLPATTIENITRVNSLCKASDSLIMTAINALVAICLIHLLPLAKFQGSLETPSRRGLPFWLTGNYHVCKQ
jgi:hypothetical protein